MLLLSAMGFIGALLRCYCSCRYRVGTITRRGFQRNVFLQAHLRSAVVALASCLLWNRATRLKTVGKNVR